MGKGKVEHVMILNEEEQTLVRVMRMRGVDPHEVFRLLKSDEHTKVKVSLTDAVSSAINDVPKHGVPEEPAQISGEAADVVSDVQSLSIRASMLEGDVKARIVQMETDLHVYKLLLVRLRRLQGSDE